MGHHLVGSDGCILFIMLIQINWLYARDSIGIDQQFWWVLCGFRHQTYREISDKWWLVGDYLRLAILIYLGACLKPGEAPMLVPGAPNPTMRGVPDNPVWIGTYFDVCGENRDPTWPIRPGETARSRWWKKNVSAKPVSERNVKKKLKRSTGCKFPCFIIEIAILEYPPLCDKSNSNKCLVYSRKCLLDMASFGADLNRSCLQILCSHEGSSPTYGHVGENDALKTTHLLICVQYGVRGWFFVVIVGSFRTSLVSTSKILGVRQFRLCFFFRRKAS